MSAFFRDPRVVRLAQLAIGLVFLAAALPKVADVPGFAKNIAAYELFPVWSHHLIAMIVPWVETVAGLALLTGIRARSGAWVSVVAMVAFTGAVVWAWSRGLSIDCGCFGSAHPEPVGGAKIAENVGFLTLAAMAGVRPRGR